MQNLTCIICRIREKPFDMSADIEAMFLQVNAKCLRFIWRESQSDDLSPYEYTRHIFGAKHSPTCAKYALQRTATDNEDKFPDVSQLVKFNFYMDDFLYSAGSTKEAETLKQNLITFLKRGELNQSKWQSKVKEHCENDSDVESVTV